MCCTKASSENALEVAEVRFGCYLPKRREDVDCRYVEPSLMLMPVFVRELEEVDHRANLPVSDARWEQVTHSSANDPVLKQLRGVIQNGWAERKSDVSECLRPCFDLRDELVVQDVLVFKGACLVVPTSMCKELMCVAHSRHIGTEGCLRRVRKCLFWPRIASDVKDYVSKCDVSLAYRTSETKEPLLQHEVISWPYAKVAADLCKSNGRPLLVVSDYFSNFIEVSHLHTITTKAVVHKLKTIFACFGIPEILVTDNGPQFGETPVASQTVVPKETPLPSSSGTVSPGHKTVHAPLTPTSPVPSAEPPSFQPDLPLTGLRSSQGERKPPARFSNYVLT